LLADSEKGTHADLANLNIISRDEAFRTLSDLGKLLENGRAMNDFGCLVYF